MTAYSDQLNAWQLILLVHRELNRSLSVELERRLGLSLPFYEVLFYVSNAGEAGLRIGQLADSLALEPSSATRLIDRMEQARLVRRRRGTIDRRATYVVLAKLGEKVLAEARARYVELIGVRFAAHLSQEEAQTLNQALDRVLAAARA